MKNRVDWLSPDERANKRPVRLHVGARESTHAFIMSGDRETYRHAVVKGGEQQLVAYHFIIGNLNPTIIIILSIIIISIFYIIIIMTIIIIIIYMIIMNNNNFCYGEKKSLMCVNNVKNVL